MRHPALALLGLALALCLCQAKAQTPAPVKPEALTAQTRSVAEPYFQAYMQRDWDTLAPLLAEQASFTDPTAEQTFGATAYLGRDAMMASFRKNYASLQHMNFRPGQVFFFGEWAVFNGTLDWTLKMPAGEIVSSSTPYQATIRVVSGKVLHHQDLVDYQPFLRGLREARAAKASAGK